jgi:hypothetical protein
MGGLMVSFYVIPAYAGIQTTTLLKALDSGSSLRYARNDELCEMPL